jgi:SulP family sulfate permease
MTPFAGYFKGILKLALAYFVAPYLEQVPMACIAGILLWVATNMIKKHEIDEVLAQGRFHTAVMVFTAVMVPLTDFLTGVISALILHFALRRFFGQKSEVVKEPSTLTPVGVERAGADAN